MAKKLNQQPIYYTYLIGWSPAQIGLKYWVYYFGSQYGKKAHPDNLWTIYFTSSQHVKQFRAKYGDPCMIKVRPRRFSSPKQCRGYEAKVLRRIDAANHPHFLNRHNDNSEFIFDATGKAAAVLVATGERLGLIRCDDPRWSSGEIKAATSNRGHSRGRAAAMVTLTGERLGSVDKSDPRWMTGEIKATAGSKKDHQPNNSKNKLPARLTATGENLGWIDVGDPRWTTGVIHAWGKDLKAARLAATDEPLGKIDLRDERWITGEIVGLNRDKKAAKLTATGERIGLVLLSDERWASGEIEAIGGARCLNKMINIT